MQTEFYPLPAGPPSPSPWPFIVIIVILVLLLVGLIIALALLSTRPSSIQTTLPIYIYGFAPGPAAREISASSGLLTPDNNSLRLTPINQSDPQAQQWRLINHDHRLLLQHVPTSKYIQGSQLTSEPSQATDFTLYGPFRNGRAYHLRSGNSYLTTKEDLGVESIQPSGQVPLNAEWMIVMGTCQSQGSGGC